MKILIASMTALFLCIMPIAYALTTEDAPTIQDSLKHYVDEGKIEGINVTVLPPDGIIYNISCSLSEQTYARKIGVTEFSKLNYEHPDVTKGWIGIFLTNSNAPSLLEEILDVYSSDLQTLVDRKNPFETDIIKIIKYIIVQRGTTSTIQDRSKLAASAPKVIHQSYNTQPKAYTSTKSSYTSSSTGSSLKDCTPIQVKGYTRKDGTKVRAHTRMPPGCG